MKTAIAIRIARSICACAAALCFLLGASPLAQVQDAGDVGLAKTFAAFLQTWLIEKDSGAAAARFASTRVEDERFMPAETYTTAEYGQRMRAGLGAAPRKVAPGEFTSRIKDLLERIRLEAPPAAQSLKEVLAVLDPNTDPELWRILNKRDVRPRPLPGLTGFIYDVRSWEDISWTASGTVGHQFANPDTLAALGRNHRAIVFRLQEARLKGSSMICTLWAQEQPAADSWRFWALIPVPTE